MEVNNGLSDNKDDMTIRELVRCDSYKAKEVGGKDQQKRRGNGWECSRGEKSSGYMYLVQEDMREKVTYTGKWQGCPH